MGRHFDEATKQKALYKAWQKIRSNGKRSSSDDTRDAVDVFDKDAFRNIRNLQKNLRNGKFEFADQRGVPVKKSSGGKRGIVTAAVRNRIVERVLLDTLQTRSKFVKSVNTQPTSVGGVPNRSVPHGLQLIDQAFQQGMIYFVRSDISRFFDDISRKTVLEQISADIGDPEFLTLLDRASTVTLGNEASLGEDRKVFPTGYDGVAQGSPLSPLFGNILLNSFDQKLNGRGVICVRFIDDFVLMSCDESKVRNAFKSALRHMSELGLQCHDPFSNNVSRDKAEYGNAHQQGGFSFLGYDCQPGQFQPNRKARLSLLSKIAERIKTGEGAISKVRKGKDSFASKSRYAQTLTVIDTVIRGWGEAFAYGNSPQTMKDLDQKIDVLLASFRNRYISQSRGMNPKDRRRTVGVGLLEDIKPKFVADAPIVLPPAPRFRTKPTTITISTDGSALGKVSKSNGTSPVGAWAFKHHAGDVEGAGSALDTTISRMELLAVIEALRSVDEGASVIIRSDSKYVVNSVNKSGQVLKHNHDLWDEFQSLSDVRSTKLFWVKGHAGDPFNEAVDTLARGAAEARLKALK